MSASNLLPIAFLAVLLLAVVLVPADKQRWSRRPWFMPADSSPRTLAVPFFAVLLALAILRALL
jgi:hypothetical protein